MELGIQLRQVQEQRLLLLPKMLQSIEILQLGSRDLQALIERELQENETLELAPPPAKEQRSRGVGEADGAADWLAQVPAAALSLHGHLLLQLGELDLQTSVRDVVSFLIGSLDHNGHLVLTADEIESCVGPGAPVSAALDVLRRLDPCGIGQPGPIEAMIAQIDDGDPDREWLLELLRHHLPALAKNRLPRVARSLGVAVDELKLLIAKLRRLSPCPGRAFAQAEPDLLRPDVVVRREDGEWQIYVDDARLPPLRVSRRYETMARRRKLPRSARDWLRGRLRAARDLMMAIELRQETLARVARATLGHQVEFLERGLAALRPLKMQVVADELRLHLSTVSRAVADKSVQTDLGVFPLRQLFDGKGVGGDASSEGESRQSVLSRIREVIAGENAVNPLSDDAIAARLKADGLDVARRTVAKYRQELGIASRWRRRAF